MPTAAGITPAAWGCPAGEVVATMQKPALWSAFSMRRRWRGSSAASVRAVGVVAAVVVMVRFLSVIAIRPP